MSNPPTPSVQSTLNDLARSSLGVVLSFILSTSLIGGSSYVVFDFPGQLFAIGRRDAETKEFLAEGDRFNAMLHLTTAGWNSKPENVGALTDIIKTLSANIEPQTLKSTYLAGALQTCVQQASALMVERGQVRGYTFTSDYYKTVQGTIDLKYDSFRRYVFTLQDALLGWDTVTSQERQMRLLQITRSAQEVFEAGALQEVLFSESEHNLDRRTATFNQQLTQNNIERVTLIIRLSLSILGIVIGGIVLALLLINFGRQLRRDARPAA